jgi:hypothetical protein
MSEPPPRIVQSLTGDLLEQLAVVQGLMQGRRGASVQRTRQRETQALESLWVRLPVEVQVETELGASLIPMASVSFPVCETRTKWVLWVSWAVSARLAASRPAVQLPQPNLLAGRPASKQPGEPG